VQLFLDRARARQDDVEAALGAGDAEVVAEICCRLDGLPLAIELAAARAGALPPRELAARLDDRFRLLVHGLRTAEPRHRTLRAAIEWSHALLAPEEQALFRRLSVFAGGFDLDAAAAVCGGDDLDETAVVDGVSRLFDKSLVVREGRDQPRYRLLETLRRFGAEQLTAAGEMDRLRDAHCRWYVGLAQRAAAALRTGSEAEWLGRLSRDHDNFRAALANLLDGPRPTEALALAADLSLFWWTHGHAREGIRWLQSGLERASDAPAEVVAAALFHLGFLWAHDTGDWAYAASFLDLGIAAARTAPDPGTASPLLGYLLALRGECANFAGDCERALALTREGAEIIRRFPDPWGAGFALWNIGFSHRCRGELADAEGCFEEMVRIEREHGIGLVLMIGCKSLAELAEERGDLERARALYEEALRLRRGLGAARLGDVHGSLPQALMALGRVAAALGDREAAQQTVTEALPLAEELRDTDTLVEARRLLAELVGNAPEVGVGRVLGDVAASRVGPHARSAVSDTSLGDLLWQHRQRLGWSQEELAERIEPAVSPNTISNLERGRTRPYRQTLAALCVALGVDASERQQIEGAWRASARPGTREQQSAQGKGVADPGPVSQGTRATSDI
jgi:tetratricopeptide (TPR) repeat protein